MEIIIFTHAERRINDILEYLIAGFGYRVREGFKNLLNEKVQHLLLYPHIVPPFNGGRNIRRYVITQHNTLYYRYLESTQKIEILTIFDTRQQPEKLKKSL